MRKRQHSIGIQMIDLLKQLHDKVVESISIDINITSNLLIECQNTAIKIGNLIEESEGVGTTTVKMLEDYCELVFNINEELIAESEKVANSEKYGKRLNRMITKIENSLKHDITVKIEAVFLPYKASMWDSFESVFEAAEADPNCDAYVIPIPYYDKNPDGSVREEHYEGDLFPKNVPITHFSEFDFGKHHPDMVFIHNPYDYGNLVTTIHPFFYADRLKTITDCLVYIPYFATTGGMSSSRAWCPVYEHVKYIAIQAKYYRDFYESSIPDEKFIAFGSPKFDKVIKKCKNPELPNENWKDIIAGRKVFFFNTSLNGMLQNTPEFLKKMEYVFEVFSSHKDLCLLWRPHPLFESTLIAMRSDCYEVFKALKEYFLKQNNWIYDDTPSVEDTISICDAYIGDAFSSVVALFGVVGKPLFILDNSINQDNYKDYSREFIYSPDVLGTNNEQDKFLISQHGKLYVSSQDNSKYEFLVDLNPYYSLPGQYKYIYEYKNKIFVFPYYAKDIVVINNVNGEIEKKMMPLSTHEHTMPGKIFIYKNKAFIIPWNHCRFIIFDMDTYEFSYSDEIGRFCREQRAEDEGIIMPIMTDKNLVFINKYASNLLEIDLESLDVSVSNIKINDEICSHYIFSKEPEISWMTLNNKKVVVKYNRKTNEKIEIPLCKDVAIENRDNKFIFSQSFEYEGKLIIPPLGEKECYVIDPETLIVDKFYIDKLIDIEKKEVEFENWNGKLLINHNDMLYLKDSITNKVYRLENDIFVEKSAEIIGDEYKKIGDAFKTNSVFLPYSCSESVLISLEKFLTKRINEHNRDIQIASFEEVNANPRGECGEEIYNFLKGQL